MKENDKIIIPLVNSSGWRAVEACGPCTVPCECTGDCIEVPPGSGICAPASGSGICVNYRPGGGNADNWQFDGGLIAPSTVETPALFKVQIKKSQITTKSVYITPGICVDMLCPDCNSYESC
jgi:hypothetical protein